MALHCSVAYRNTGSLGLCELPKRHHCYGTFDLDGVVKRFSIGGVHSKLCLIRSPVFDVSALLRFRACSIFPSRLYPRILSTPVIFAFKKEIFELVSLGASNAMTSTSASLQQLQAETQALLDGPAGTPPVGVLPTFDDSRNMNIAVIVGLCLASATLLVLMRMYTKLFLLRSRAYEDCESHGAPSPYCN